MEFEIENINTGTRHWIKSNNNKLYLDEQNVELNIFEDSKDCFHVIWNGKGFTVELVKIDNSEKQVWLRVNNQMMSFKGRSRVHLLLEKMGISNLTSVKNKELKAPMPGLISKIITSSGSTVKKGDAVLILEAMKMENILKSPIDGVVEKVLISEKQTVDKNQLLIRFE